MVLTSINSSNVALSHTIHYNKTIHDCTSPKKGQCCVVIQGRERVVGEHTTRSGALVATILSVKMEIDDDDRDVIEAHVEISNEATIPMGQLEAVVETTEGTSFHS